MNPIPVLHIVVILCLLTIGWAFGKPSASTVDIEIHNTSILTVQTEVKCDNIPGTNNYKYYNKFLVPKKSKYILKVRTDLRNCEIWPKVKW